MKDAELDELYDKIDGLIGEEKFSELDTMIAELDMSKIGTIMAVGWLTLTLVAKDRLLSRAGLVSRCEARLQKLGVDRVDELLKGLR